jgi:predicted PurR-regulated permease PerM
MGAGRCGFPATAGAVRLEGKAVMVTERSSNTAVVCLAIIAVLAAASLASTVIAPLAAALFIVAMVWPIQGGLERYVPQYIALVFSVLLVVAVFGAFAFLVTWAFGRVGRWVVSDVGRLQELYAQFATWLEGHGIELARSWGEYFNASWIVRMVQSVTSRLNTMLSFWLVVFVYVVLGLLEVRDFEGKARRLGNRRLGRLLIEGTATTAAKLQRYMVVRTVMSFVTGFLVWLLAYVAGLQFAAEWGVIAFTLNYIPFIGPFLATTFPTMFAAAQFETWQAVVVLFVCLNLIQFIVGSYIEPRVAGSALSVSPVLILFSVFFWAFLWGPFGAFIGVPISIAIVTFCALHPSSRWLAQLLGSGSDDLPEVVGAD